MISSSPKVSILIPTYNRANFLKCAIESALNQDYPNKEIIISDNASTDATFEVVKAYLDNPTVKYFKNDVNIGGIPNWRKALYEYASGKYAILLSDDDYFVDNSYISKAVDLLCSNDKLGFVHANYVIYYQDKGFALEYNFNMPSIVDGREYFVNFGIYPFPLLTVVIFNRELAIKIDAFSENIPSADILLYLKLMLCSDVGFVKGIAGIQRIHGKNWSKNLTLQDYIQNLMAYTKAAELAKKNGLENQKIDEFLDRNIRNFLLSYLNVNELIKFRKKYNIPTSGIIYKGIGSLRQEIITKLFGHYGFYTLRKIRNRLYDKLGIKYPKDSSVFLTHQDFKKKYLC